MWKLLLAFVVFAAVALFALKKSGGNVDMGGEKHEVSAPAQATESASAASSAAGTAASAVAPASAASN
jgi:hypothetical protein